MAYYGYDQNFINENFINYGDLKGVFIFGEEDIEAKKRIADLTELKKSKSDEYRRDGYDHCCVNGPGQKDRKGQTHL